MDEFSLIEIYFAPLAGEGAVGLKDDAAFLAPPPGHTLVVTTDAIAEGVHYLGSEPPGLIAQKLLRVNLSDLAAKGAAPWGCFLSLVLPQQADENWIAGFASGLAEDLRAFGFALFGGDTTRSTGPASFSATLLGLVPEGEARMRRGAEAGDWLCVTGTLGDAGLGLLLLQSTITLPGTAGDFLRQRYFLPSPRLGFRDALRKHATAAMDLSDGIAQDASHLALASGVALVIEEARLPLSAPARAALASYPAHARLPLHGGDDYEILCTLPERSFAALADAAIAAGTTLTAIGRVERGRGVRILDAGGNPVNLEKSGWQPF